MRLLICEGDEKHNSGDWGALGVHRIDIVGKGPARHGSLGKLAEDTRDGRSLCWEGEYESKTRVILK